MTQTDLYRKAGEIFGLVLDLLPYGELSMHQEVESGYPRITYTIVVNARGQQYRSDYAIEPKLIEIGTSTEYIAREIHRNIDKFMRESIANGR